jgi:hypothetical protein
MIWFIYLNAVGQFFNQTSKSWKIKKRKMYLLQISKGFKYIKPKNETIIRKKSS